MHVITLEHMVQRNSLMGMWMCVCWGWGKVKTSFHGLSIVIVDTVHQTFHNWEHSKNCIILILEMEHN